MGFSHSLDPERTFHLARMKKLRHCRRAIQVFRALPFWAQISFLIVPTASACFAAIGLLLTFYQSRRTNAQARAALVAECLKGFTEDDGIQRAWYAIAYSQFRYTAGFQRSELQCMSFFMALFGHAETA